jgi:hypothetical protein
MLNKMGAGPRTDRGTPGRGRPARRPVTAEPAAHVREFRPPVSR